MAERKETWDMTGPELVDALVCGTFSSATMKSAQACQVHNERAALAARAEAAEKALASWKALDRLSPDNHHNARMCPYCNPENQCRAEGGRDGE